MFSQHTQDIPTSKTNMIKKGPNIETCAESSTLIYDDHVHAPKTRDRRDATRRPAPPTSATHFQCHPRPFRLEPSH